MWEVRATRFDIVVGDFDKMYEVLFSIFINSTVNKKNVRGTTVQTKYDLSMSNDGNLLYLFLDMSMIYENSL
jgi:hypothetical protein